MRTVTLIILISLLPCHSSLASQSIRDTRLEFALNKMQQLPELQLLLEERKYTSPNSSDEFLTGDNSWSEIIGHGVVVEFNKTMSSLYNLSLIFDGSYSAYQKFIFPQSVKPLNFKSFQALHDEISPIKPLRHLVELNLVMRDLGKSSKFYNLVKQECNVEIDDTHQLVAFVTNKCPNIIKSFVSISDQNKELLEAVNSIHLGHFINAEGGVEVLERFIKYKGHYNSRAHAVLVATNVAELSAFKAYEAPYGSITFNETLWNYTSKALDAIKTIVMQDKKAIIKQYLKSRDSGVKFSDNNIHNPDILIKIAILARVNGKNDINYLQNSLKQLPEYQQIKISKVFNPYLDYQYTPTYLPAVFDNVRVALQKVGKSNHEIIDFFTSYTIPFIAQILQRELNSQAQYTRIISFKKVASDLIKSLDYIKTGVFYIDHQGIVSFKERGK